MSDNTVGNQDTGLVSETTGAGTDQILNTTPTTEVNFLETIPEEFRADPSLQSFKSVGDLAKSYVHAQKAIGKKFEDFSADEIKARYSELAAPASVDDYKFDFGKDADVNGEALDWFKGVAQKNGIPVAAAKELAEGYYKIQQEQMSEYNALKEQTMAEHEKAVKVLFGDQFDVKVQAANRALSELGGEDTIKALNEAGLSSHPAIVGMLANVGELMNEGTLTTSSKVQNVMTPERANEKISELWNDEKFTSRYTNAMAPGHKEAVDQLTKLYQIRAGVV